ncbi:hypothetical protein U879_13365 [Defluviimonas sp. 20V17]|jgi:hypothetical protein|uniref:DUF3489 domain-containing protein n=1 Tax=Allgaiera indica TaxID=765699 RepID=A0AAN4UR68_9RHOB|nr:DUF3489 domain-containing protein [Allgaiera indica]KDB03173.1 hypothetical protein U879_13365 [Defluviimonas sp. 20V17]GHE01007.1 hypothetical protein GCM10008024_14920 [Allgaiera indica]SDW76225.1 Protein of unknown function [Allgaiera indica]
MTKLSDTQAIILGAAAQRDDRNVLPLPGSLRGGAAQKVIGALMKRGLIAETVTDQLAKADPALNRIWRNDEDGCAILLHVTDAGLAAIGIEPEQPDTKPAPKTRKPRTGTKQARMIEMLRDDVGATIDEIVEATGWQAHTVRGAMSGALKKKLGMTITSEKVEGRGRVYRIASD